MTGFNIITLWPILGALILIVPIFWGPQDDRWWRVATGILLAAGAYFVLCMDSCLLFALYYIGFIIFCAYFMPKFGVFDARFATKKYVYYQSVALIIFYFLCQASVGSTSGVVLLFIFFGIVLSAFPFHGWLESFAMHAPSGILGAYLGILYPLSMFFMLKLFSVVLAVQNYGAFLGGCLGIGWLGALFVPILFFARTENRRFLAYLTIWSTGLVFLFLAYCSMSDYVVLAQFGIVQGVLLAVLSQCFIYLHRILQHDRLLNLGSIRSLSAHCYFIVLLVMCMSWISPLVFALFFITLPISGWAVLSCSLIIYGYFLKNLMQSRPEKNYLSFR